MVVAVDSYEVGSDAFASHSVEDAPCQVAFDDSFYSAVEVEEVAAEALYYPLEIYCLILQDHNDQNHYSSVLCLEGLLLLGPASYQVQAPCPSYYHVLHVVKAVPCPSY